MSSRRSERRSSVGGSICSIRSSRSRSAERTASATEEREENDEAVRSVDRAIESLREAEEDLASSTAGARASEVHPLGRRYVARRPSDTHAIVRVGGSQGSRGSFRSLRLRSQVGGAARDEDEDEDEEDEDELRRIESTGRASSGHAAHVVEFESKATSRCAVLGHGRVRRDELVAILTALAQKSGADATLLEYMTNDELCAEAKQASAGEYAHLRENLRRMWDESAQQGYADIDALFAIVRQLDPDMPARLAADRQVLAAAVESNRAPRATRQLAVDHLRELCVEIERLAKQTRPEGKATDAEDRIEELADDAMFAVRHVANAAPKSLAYANPSYLGAVLAWVGALRTPDRVPIPAVLSRPAILELYELARRTASPLESLRSRHDGLKLFPAPVGRSLSETKREAAQWIAAAQAWEAAKRRHTAKSVAAGAVLGAGALAAAVGGGLIGLLALSVPFSAFAAVASFGSILPLLEATYRAYIPLVAIGGLAASAVSAGLVALSRVLQPAPLPPRPGMPNL